MDSNQKFWVSIWLIVALSIVSIIVTGSLYYSAQADKMVVMVKNGADPIKAMCAFGDYGSPGRVAVCAQATTPRFPNEY